MDSGDGRSRGLQRSDCGDALGRRVECSDSGKCSDCGDVLGRRVECSDSGKCSDCCDVLGRRVECSDSGKCSDCGEGEGVLSADSHGGGVGGRPGVGSMCDREGPGGSLPRSRAPRKGGEGNVRLAAVIEVKEGVGAGPWASDDTRRSGGGVGLWGGGGGVEWN